MITNKGLYVDDIRDLPPSCEGWDLARNYDEAIKLLTEHEYDRISLDHDIASFREDGREMTGYDIALWLAQRKHDNLYVPSNIYIHSANPVGRDNMQSVINRYLTDDDIS